MNRRSRGDETHFISAESSVIQSEATCSCSGLDGSWGQCAFASNGAPLHELVGVEVTRLTVFLGGRPHEVRVCLAGWVKTPRGSSTTKNGRSHLAYSAFLFSARVI